jgi:hypothetical protein
MAAVDLPRSRLRRRGGRSTAGVVVEMARLKARDEEIKVEE